MAEDKFKVYFKKLKPNLEKLKCASTKIFKEKSFTAAFDNFAQFFKKGKYFNNLIQRLKEKPRRLLSLDFGRSFVKIIYIEIKQRNFKLLNYDLKKLSIGEDNKTEAVNFINNFLKTNFINERQVCLSISDLASIYINDVSLPVIPRREIPEALKWQLKQEVPFDLDSALFDWQVIKESTDQEGAKKNDILFVTVKREIVDRYLSIVRECNLFPISISSAPFNYANLLAYYAEDERHIQAVLDIGYKETALSIYKNNKLNFVRLLPFSSDKLTQALTSTLFSDREKFALSYEKAEEIKEAVGIPQDDSIVLEDNITGGQIRSLMRFFLEDLIKELRRSFNYFISNYKEQEPAILYITGGGGNLKNLDVYLRGELNINVCKLFLPECIDTQAITKEKLNKVQNQIINAIGAVLAGPGAINLLPPEVKAQRLEFIEKISLRLIAVAVGAILLFSLLFVKLQIGDYKKRLKHANVHLQTIRQIKVLRQENVLLESLVDKIQKEKVPVDGLLKVISNIVPQDVILNELLLGQDRHILILRGIISQESGGAGTAITNFMEKLEASPLFKEATLVSSRRVSGIHSFEIKCDLVD